MKTTTIVSMIVLGLTINLNAANPQTGGEVLSIKNKAVLFASLRHIEENTRKVSDWMLNEKTFEPGTEMTKTAYLMSKFAAPVEESRQIEEWMLNESLFTYFEEAAEIEPWMFDEELFSNSSNETMKQIKEWMLDADGLRIQ